MLNNSQLDGHLLDIIQVRYYPVNMRCWHWRGSQMLNPGRHRTLTSLLMFGMALTSYALCQPIRKCPMMLTVDCQPCQILLWNENLCQYLKSEGASCYWIVFQLLGLTSNQVTQCPDVKQIIVKKNIFCKRQEHCSKSAQSKMANKSNTSKISNGSNICKYIIDLFQVVSHVVRHRGPGFNFKIDEVSHLH